MRRPTTLSGSRPAVMSTPKQKAKAPAAAAPKPPRARSRAQPAELSEFCQSFMDLYYRPVPHAMAQQIERVFVADGELTMPNPEMLGVYPLPANKKAREQPPGSFIIGELENASAAPTRAEWYPVKEQKGQKLSKEQEALRKAGKERLVWDTIAYMRLPEGFYVLVFLKASARQELAADPERQISRSDFQLVGTRSLPVIYVPLLESKQPSKSYTLMQHTADRIKANGHGYPVDIRYIIGTYSKVKGIKAPLVGQPALGQSEAGDQDQDQEDEEQEARDVDADAPEEREEKEQEADALEDAGAEPDVVVAEGHVDAPAPPAPAAPQALHPFTRDVERWVQRVQEALPPGLRNVTPAGALQQFASAAFAVAYARAVALATPGLAGDIARHEAASAGAAAPVPHTRWPAGGDGLHWRLHSSSTAVPLGYLVPPTAPPVFTKMAPMYHGTNELGLSVVADEWMALDGRGTLCDAAAVAKLCDAWAPGVPVARTAEDAALFETALLVLAQPARLYGDALAAAMKTQHVAFSIDSVQSDVRKLVEGSAAAVAAGCEAFFVHATRLLVHARIMHDVAGARGL